MQRGALICRRPRGSPKILAIFGGSRPRGSPKILVIFGGFTSNGRLHEITKSISVFGGNAFLVYLNEFYVRFVLTHLLYSSVSKTDTFPAMEGKTQLKISSTCTIHDLVSIHVQRTIYDAQASIHVACDNSSKKERVPSPFSFIFTLRYKG